MKIDNVEITCLSNWDGLPIKNQLPPELKERLKTKNQWMEEGYVLKPDVTGYVMHPSMLAKKTYTYYLDNEVCSMDEDALPECCATCDIREGRYCMVAGDYVKMDGRCSEWC